MQEVGADQPIVVTKVLRRFADSFKSFFPHYAFDRWMKRTHPDLPWCRYADDGLVHCRTEQEAEAVKAALQARLAECQLELHPTKTKIVYCRDSKNAEGNIRT
ncbi:reverse transcriptase domain-containing protein [Mesorhizobium sp. L103C131B0]|uniref:reverse transcriptase domain-containing protein n=1 Tax=Mesorhizobium sp. L103C131B0 TaxID=1287089 RepID=UPI001FD92D16|nr:reverse transcriptase domain-containing protein [Mesorhizobium sp. L103C131B0]